MKQNNMTKTKGVLAGMAALLLAFGLILTGCGDSDDGDPSSPSTPPGPSAAVVEFQNTLKKLGDTTAEKPSPVVLRAIVISKDDDDDTSDWGKVNKAVEDAQKYVILSLSDCTFRNNTVEGSSSGDTGMNLFKNNPYIKGIILPETVTSIGESAFKDCSGLTSVDIPKKAQVTSIGASAFYGCSGLTSVDIPSNVASIGVNAFNGCFGLTSVSIPANVTSIGSGAFTDCTGLTNVNILTSSNLASIGYNAFYNCTGLTSVKIPGGVTSIESYAFYNCTNLATVELPANVTTIGNFAFPGSNNALRTKYQESGSVASIYTWTPGSSSSSSWTKQP
ncbi:MAG: leucine-rich repeat domain-containing protein [Treponema sp.]|jgi:hypothetical protein|nr:leucine-rich repeat domain-containing protein [Treponema sp.]